MGQVQGHAYIGTDARDLIVTVVVEMSLSDWRVLAASLGAADGEWSSPHKRLCSVVKSVVEKFEQKVVEAQGFEG